MCVCVCMYVCACVCVCMYVCVHVCACVCVESSDVVHQTLHFSGTSTDDVNNLHIKNNVIVVNYRVSAKMVYMHVCVCVNVCVGVCTHTICHVYVRACLYDNYHDLCVNNVLRECVCVCVCVCTMIEVVS